MINSVKDSSNDNELKIPSDKKALSQSLTGRIFLSQVYVK